MCYNLSVIYRVLAEGLNSFPLFQLAACFALPCFSGDVPLPTIEGFCGFFYAVTVMDDTGAAGFDNTDVNDGNLSLISQRMTIPLKHT